jgi:hypothetical protein
VTNKTSQAARLRRGGLRYLALGISGACKVDSPPLIGVKARVLPTVRGGERMAGYSRQRSVGWWLSKRSVNYKSLDTDGSLRKFDGLGLKSLSRFFDVVFRRLFVPGVFRIPLGAIEPTD